MKYCLFGHPFAGIGMAEQMLSHLKALISVGADVGFVDIFKYAQRTDLEIFNEIRNFEQDTPTGDIAIFHCNGDEVSPVLAHLESKFPDWRKSFKKTLIIPAWELPVYPEVWATELKKFDHVLGISEFVSKSIGTSIGSHVPVVGQSVDRPYKLASFRKKFSIRESAFVFLAFFDFSSYVSRKNPEALLSFSKVLEERVPNADFQICLKTKTGRELSGEKLEEILDIGQSSSIKLIDGYLDSRTQRELMGCADAFVSLHRSEGFGRGLAEMMALGLPVIATQWSGSADIVKEGFSLPVGSQLVPVAENAYPFADGQVWAEPDISQAAAYAEKLIVDRQYAQSIGKCGSDFIDANFSHEAVGIKLMEAVRRLG